MNWIKKSIRRRLLVTFLLAIAVPLLISSTLIYVNTREVVQNEKIKEAEQLFKEGKKNIAFYFDLINKASLSIYMSKYSEKNMSTILKKEPDEETDAFVLQSLNTMYEFDDDIFQIYLYLEPIEQGYLFKDYLMSTKDMTDGYIRKNPQAAYITGMTDGTSYGISHLIKTVSPVISFHRNIYDIPSTKQSGQLVIDLKASVLNRLCETLYDPKVHEFYLINLEDQQVLFASDKSMIGTQMNGAMLSAAQAAISAGSNNFDWAGTDAPGICVADVIEKPYMKLLLIKQIPNKTIQKEVNDLVEVTLFIAGTTVLGILLVSITISYFYTKPINALLKTMEEVRLGNLEATIDITEEDEFGKLKHHFNEMLNSINEHIQVEYILGMENALNELRALQGQINSHFMNNILQAIGTEALKSGNVKVYRLIVRLGNMMQYSMHNQNQLVFLKDELEYCTNYLELQKHRFEGAFEYGLDVEEEVKSVRVPKVILQPIIENCFIHGLQETPQMGYIQVRCRRELDRLVIEVTDNGKGIDGDKLQELNAVFKAVSEGEVQNETEGSIGLRNIGRRLWFYYKGQSRLTVCPNPIQGLMVRLEMPLEPTVRGERYNENIDRG